MAHHPNSKLINLKLLFIQSLIWFGLFGLSIYILGLIGRLNQVNILILSIIPLLGLTRLTDYLLRRLFIFSPLEKFLSCMVILLSLLYLLGVFVPETGFDALWYHLPEAQVYMTTGRIAKIPELLYSAMPRLGEMYFAAAFSTHSLVLVKFAAYLYSLFFVLVSYFLARNFLSRPHSLLVALTVNSLYLVAWQSSSAYVDLPRAVFELGALLCLCSLFKIPDLRHFQIRDLFLPLAFAAILTGFSLSVKIQGLIGLFALSVFLVMSLRSLRLPVLKILSLVSCFLFLALFIASPWYLDNHFHHGSPFYPANTITTQQDILNHVGASSNFEWLIRRVRRLPLIFWDLGTKPVYQLTPILIILFPIFLLQFKQIIKSRLVLTTICYSLVAILLWWFIPPAESRYLLPTLPPLIILLFYATFSLPVKYLGVKQLAIIFIIASVAVNFTVRAVVSAKYLPVIIGRQSPQDYITSQTTDFNRSIVEKFYSDYWLDYQYQKTLMNIL